MIKKFYSAGFVNGLEYYYAKKKASFNVSIEVWVKVGSHNEMPHEYGICHMIEHMIFKGSEKIELGALDTIFYMMGGKTNAYTSKDFTVYTFSVPKDYFESLISILFDLFEEPRFDEQDLVTEKEVVIQEIQLYEDDSYSQLFDEAFTNSDSKCNYQHEILGNRKTVQSFSEKQLYDFYKKYYVPANMKFFILGDLPFKIVEEIMENSRFAKIKSNNLIVNTPIKVANKTIKKVNYLYTETLNKHFLLTYLFPVCSYDKVNLFKSLNLLLGGGKDSLLYEKLHIELKLVTDIRSFFHGLIGETYYFIYFNPIKFEDVSLIVTHIYAIINSVIAQEYDYKKLEKIENILEFQHAALMSENADDFFSQYAPYAFEKKRNFLIRKKIPLHLLQNKLTRLAGCFKHKQSVINAILPYVFDVKRDKQDNVVGESIEESSLEVLHAMTGDDRLEPKIKDNYIIDLGALKKERKARLGKIRDSGLFLIKNNLPRFVPFLESKEVLFDNGLKAILINDNENNDIVVIVLSLKVKHYYDNDIYLGGIAFLFDWLYEGTKNFSGTKFIETIEKYGIEFYVNIGTIEIKFLKKHLGVAMELLSDFLCHPEFSLERFDLLKMQARDNIKNFMDDACSVGLQKIREMVYGSHPYAKNPSGTLESMDVLTPEVVKELYKKYISPDGALLFVVGSVDEYEIKRLIQSFLAGWQYKKIEELLLPVIERKKNNATTYVSMDKDQTVIIYGGLSVKKYSKEFYYLLLADQLLSGSITDSMHAVLFQIRDKSGMFYDISGSLVSGCSRDCGMVIIKAMTDRNNVARAIKNIDNVINNFISFITKEDLLLAKKSLLFAMAEKNSSKASILNCFLNKYRYNLSEENFKQQYDIIKKASINDIKETIRLYFNQDELKKLIIQNNK
jgi:zinc protease